MAGNFRYSVPTLFVILCGQKSAVWEWDREHGRRSDRRSLSERSGKPLWRYQALFSADGLNVLGVGTLRTTSEVDANQFGEPFRTVGPADVAFSPGSEFEVRLTVDAEAIEPVRSAEAK